MQADSLKEKCELEFVNQAGSPTIGSFYKLNNSIPLAVLNNAIPLEIEFGPKKPIVFSQEFSFLGKRLVHGIKYIQKGEEVNRKNSFFLLKESLDRATFSWYVVMDP